jgi:hypothetical protein
MTPWFCRQPAENIFPRTCSPSKDKYYRVQVGPFKDQKSADAAKKGPESAGFKAFVVNTDGVASVASSSGAIALPEFPQLLALLAALSGAILSLSFTARPSFIPGSVWPFCW